MAFTVAECSSSSASSSTSQCSYHVFLSFRGEDTRRGFTSHLFDALQRKGVKTFKDDNDLERGLVIKPELLKAIEESMFAVIILSSDYASSTWCLDELQKIVDRSNNLGLQILPIFYGVQPSHVRHQTGSFAEAFKKHEENFPEDTEKVKRWRDALRQVANISGWDFKDWHEAAFVEDIVEHIHRRLIPKFPSCTENLVGISSRVEEVTSLIGTGLNDVRFIGIWGMGGMGKTTTARSVYEMIRYDFKVSCFLANIREVSETKGLLHLQRELLSCLNVRGSDFHNLFDGQKAIRNSLCNKKVLLVLDDVSEVSQLENLAEKQDWFGPGSRVIITTRDKHMLVIHEVQEIYNIRGLVQSDALRLFYLKAFKGDQPKEGYLDLSKKVVEYTGGLPLALRVLGSHLCGRPIDVWHSALEQMRSIPHPKIQDTLKISFEGLHSMEKDMFLDIACFYKGMPKDDVIPILKNCGYFPEIGIDILIERSLVTQDWGKFLGMHDLLQEMGRHIVFQESPNNPSGYSRLWSPRDIDCVLTENKGTEKIQSIVIDDTESYKVHVNWSIEAFSKMSQLKFLSVRSFGVLLPLGVNYLPSSLKVLHWERCPLRTLPFTNQQNEVVDIKLRYSEIEQLWHGTKFLEKLKYMDLSYSRNLQRLPDFSGVPNLETLLLWQGASLIEVHPSLLCHKRLVLLDLSICQSLEAFPSKLEMSSLKMLVLDLCSQFKILPEFGECMKHLSKLSLFGTAITELPTSLGCLVGLAKLELGNCRKLISLPDTICRLKSLKFLGITGCSKLRSLPEGMKEIKGLEELRALETGIEELPSFIFKLENLRKLEFGWREDGTSNSLNLFLRSFMDFPYDFSHLSSLEILNLSGKNFVSLPCSVSKLPKLAYLRLNWCRKLKSLPELPPSIRRLEGYNCDSLESSRFNPSKLCSLFASPVQPMQSPGDEDKDADRAVLASCNARFEMCIPGSEIPSWFVSLPLPLERSGPDGFRAKIPLPPDCLRNEWVGIALCFQFRSTAAIPFPRNNFMMEFFLFICDDCSSLYHISYHHLPGLEPNLPHLYFLCLSIDEFRDIIHKDGHWTEFGIKSNCYGLKMTRGGYRLVYKQDDVEDFWNEQSNDDMQDESKIFGADDMVGPSQKPNDDMQPDSKIFGVDDIVGPSRRLCCIM